MSIQRRLGWTLVGLMLVLFASTSFAAGTGGHYGGAIDPDGAYGGTIDPDGARVSVEVDPNG